MKGLVIAGALMAAPFVAAQQTVWGQCGGVGWTGATSCVSGSYCSKLNDYYFQCIPGAASTTVVTTSSRTTTTTTPTTIRTTTTTTSATRTTTTPPVTTGPTVTATGNPFAGKTQWANPYYASEVSNIAIPSFIAAGKTALATQAARVANIPSFTWLDTMAKVPSVRTYLAAIKAGGIGNNIAPFVVYDLPDRDCAALASNGEYSIANGGAANYRAYIDAIRAILVDYPDIPVVLIIEPDSLANLVTNLSVSKCSNAAATYKDLTVYAVKQLALPNVSMYLDGGHGGWLGWPANLPGAATLYAQIYKDSGSPKQLRGLATNVSNYNAWSLATCPSYTSPNPNCDEKKYINAIGPALSSAGWPGAHFVVDQSRSGHQPTSQIEQGDWCNVINSGFGIRPDTTPTDPLLDAFVWIKPGGESDGTSDTSSVRYDSHCGLSDALKPAPEAGQWFQAFFESLIVNANPAI